jgi:hypothetical protein
LAIQQTRKPARLYTTVYNFLFELQHCGFGDLNVAAEVADIKDRFDVSREVLARLPKVLTMISSLGWLMRGRG